MIELTVTIPIASQWPTREELALRNAVESALAAGGTGHCSGAGGGMGKMHLTYRVNHESDVPQARTSIDDAMRSYMPNAKYVVEVFRES